jgi:hypothetical protein
LALAFALFFGWVIALTFFAFVGLFGGFGFTALAGGGIEYLYRRMFNDISMLISIKIAILVGVGAVSPSLSGAGQISLINNVPSVSTKSLI